MSNLLLNPQSGSADPSASLPALWSYIQPALDHIIRSPTNNLSKAPAVDINYHMGIHTALYNYFTHRTVAAPPPPPPPSHLVKGTSAPTPPPPPRGSSTVHSQGQDVYDRLDAYLADVAREVFLGAPLDDSALVHYLVPCFIRYSAGARSIDRLMNYLNRQYVKRAVDEDKGWLRFGDIISSQLAEGQAAAAAAALAPGRSGVVVVKGGDGDERGRPGCVASHRSIAEKMHERRVAELRRWGAPDSATAEQLALAEACAEAGSAPGCVLPVLSLAYRRFRTEVLEPLLALPKPKGESKGKGKKKKRKGSDSPATSAVVLAAEVDKAPRGRLARSVKEFLESKRGDEEERTRFACEMADMLMRVGIRPEHPLRRKLGKRESIV